MTITRTGYEQDNQGVWIAKDPGATLTYSMEWAEWLPEGDSISSVTYTLQVRANDPEPLIKSAEGVQSGHITYVTLSGGQVSKVYTITAEVTTDSGEIDRRNFRVKVENRSA